jgi:Domain of unknown function (DUF4430)
VEEAVVHHRRWILLLLAAVLAGTVSGCGRVSDRSTGGAHQLITEGFGARVLHDGPALDGHSAMDALRGVATVETGYGGGFVSAIDGVRSDLGKQRDWFYFVNGVAPGRGADQQNLRTGDSVWWDYRAWGGLPEGAPVVGLWPEPFVHGYPDPPNTVTADPPLDAALRSAGAPVGSGPSDWRVIVGADQALRIRDATWRAAMTDPASAGLTVRISGDHIEALTSDGTTFATIPTGRAIAVAVSTGTDPDHAGVLVAVAGLDASAAQAAAATIAGDPAVLRGRFAVVFDADGHPVSTGGRA